MTKLLLRVLFIALCPFLVIISATPAFADSVTSGAVNQVCQGIGAANGTGSGCSPDHGAGSIDHIIGEVVNTLTIIVGITAVIMIIVAGLRFVISGGESANVASARNSILYIVIGLVVVALAQIIVHFVLYNVSKA